MSLGGRSGPVEQPSSFWKDVDFVRGNMLGVEKMSDARVVVTQYQTNVTTEMEVFRSNPPVTHNQTTFDSIGDYIWRMNDRLDFMMSLYDKLNEQPIMKSGEPGSKEDEEAGKKEKICLDGVYTSIGEWSKVICDLESNWAKESAQFILEFRARQVKEEERDDSRRALEQQRQQVHANNGSDEDEEAVGGARAGGKKKENAILRPNVLSLEDGVAGRVLWSRKFRACFTGSGFTDTHMYSEAERREFFLMFIDADLTSRFDEWWSKSAV